MRTAQQKCLLVLNAAEGLIQCLIAEQDTQGEFQQRCFEEWEIPSQGTELLLPLLDKALCSLALAPDNLKLLAGVQGPGSFTGIRLVLATLSGFAAVTGAEQAGVPYLPLLARQAALDMAVWEGAYEKKIRPIIFWVLTYARRNLVHLQGFIHEGQDLQPITEILVCSPQESIEHIKQAGGTAVLLGSGLAKNKLTLESGLADYSGRCVLLPDRYNHPFASSLLHAGIHASYTLDDISPLYARGSDAEENLAAIAQGLGLSGEEAEAALRQLTSA